MLRLSGSKKNILHAVLRNGPILEALDALLPFTGLWDGLRLGNVHKHLALHCDEDIISYLHHVRDIWNRILGTHDEGAHDEAKGLLDVETVQFLQYKSPSTSPDDKKSIREAMGRGELFALVSDRGARDRILQNVLSLQVVIPSIASFHKNMKYFSIGAKIIQKYVECVKPSGSRAKRPSTFQNLCEGWKPPERPIVQTGEDEYVTLKSPLTPELAYAQLFLAALRSFPRLGTESPLQDRHGEKMAAFPDEKYLARFLQTARTLGFQNATGNQAATGAGPYEDAVPPPRRESLLDWRGGVPSTSVFRELQRNSFLPTLYQTHETSAARSVLFVQNDLIGAYFGTFDIQLAEDVAMADTDTSRRSVDESVNQPIDIPQDSAMTEPPPVPQTEHFDSIPVVPTPSRSDVRSPSKQPTSRASPGRVRKRAPQHPKGRTSTSRRGTGLAREEFEFHIPMPQQREERRLERHAREETPRVDLLPRLEVGGVQSAQKLAPANPPSTTPSGRRILEARRSVQVPTGDPRPILPILRPEKRKQPPRAPESDDASVAIRQQASRPPRNFKRARFIENSLTAIHEHQQLQISQGGSSSGVDRETIRPRREAARSIQVLPGLRGGTGEKRPSAEEIADRRTGKLFHAAPGGLMQVLQTVPRPEMVRYTTAKSRHGGQCSLVTPIRVLL